MEEFKTEMIEDTKINEEREEQGLPHIAELNDFEREVEKPPLPEYEG